MNASDPNSYFDLRGLAEYSSLAVPTLRSYLRGLRPIPHFKMGGKILVRRAEFDKWMEGFRVDSSRLEKIVDGVLASLK
jgi:hypothetical protein